LPSSCISGGTGKLPMMERQGDSAMDPRLGRRYSPGGARDDTEPWRSTDAPEPFLLTSDARCWEDTVYHPFE
jgi:hypothetical protein